jgi:hypothetical protein
MTARVRPVRCRGSLTQAKVGKVGKDEGTATWVERQGKVIEREKERRANEGESGIKMPSKIWPAKDGRKQERTKTSLRR